MEDYHWRRYKNYVFLIPLFALALFYQVTYSVVAINLAMHRTTVPERTFTKNEDNVATVSAVDASAARSGLRPGDRILAVDGRELTNDRVLLEEVWKHKPSESLALTVVSKGESKSRTLLVPLRAHGGKPASAGDYALQALYTGMMLFCVLVGVYVAAVRPYDVRAVILFGLMISLSQIVTSANFYHFPEFLWTFAAIWYAAAILSWSIWLVCFGLYFPERFEWDVKRPWVKWLFLGPLTILNALTLLGDVKSLWAYRSLALLNALIGATPVLVITAAMAFFFTCLGVKGGTAKTRDAKRRLRILYWGATVGLGPLGCSVIYRNLFNKNAFNFPQWIEIVVGLLFCIFPLTLAYVIVVERAMDLKMVIRQGVRYTLAKGGMRFLLSASAAFLIWRLNLVVFGSRLSLPAKIVIAAVSIVILIIAIRRTRKRLLVWIDRKYFREAYDAERLLEDLSDSVRSMVEEQELLDTVARRISESLHVPHLAILLNGRGALRPVYCLGFDASPELALPENCKTVDLVKQAKDPPRIYFDRKDNWVHNASETELVTLKAIHAQLLLPIGLKDKLLGIFSLGPKRSEEPYSRTDVHLLRSVALQTGLALENSRLVSAVAEETAQRERLNREIEIAREVQERLFPQRLPAIAGIDYSGSCRPALGVGGDYYDFLTLANGDLGIAIGDVSGKGIAAALLMASLQASLRGQAMMGQGDLARLMCNVNQLVFDATPMNRYATFFYGQYNRESRVLTYVNAGHNPPVVLRRTADGAVHVIRLDTGGPVVGLFPSAPYQQGSLVMEPGDLFLGFTDGVSEAMNNEEEEWGEERLIPAVAATAEKTAAEIIPALMAEADRFASGAPQHDDMTLVVMKMCEARAA